MSHLATSINYPIDCERFHLPNPPVFNAAAAPPGQAVSDPKADEDLINVRDKLGDTAGSPRDQRSIAQRHAPPAGPPVMFVGL